MAEIKIKIFDTEEGGIDCTAEFTPEWNPQLKSTPAQNVAGMVLEALATMAQKAKEVPDEDDEDDVVGVPV